MGIGFKTLFVFALAASAAFANEDLRFADSCYAARAERAKGDKADAHNAKLMIDAYHKATSDASVEEAATEGYVKSDEEFTLDKDNHEATYYLSKEGN